ncbi:hypothetical protein MOSE0_F07514 [Monosporozyma servazzii]
MNKNTAEAGGYELQQLSPDSDGSDSQRTPPNKNLWIIYSKRGAILIVLLASICFILSARLYFKLMMLNIHLKDQYKAVTKDAN